MGSAWKVAYADFVTAMMAFFLLLWILNATPPETKAGLAAYFNGDKAFESSSTSPISNNPFIQNTNKINQESMTVTETQKTHIAIAKKIKDLVMADAVPQKASGISPDDVGVQLRINSDVLFLPGSAEYTPMGIKVLESVKEIMQEYNLYLVVRGHAGSSEVRAPYTSAWELSGARAANGISWLSKNGVKSTRMRGVCYGDTRPIRPGYDEASQAVNRRVEFYFHRPEVMSYSVVY